jgi:atypical dual specificity phosphatase
MELLVHKYWGLFRYYAYWYMMPQTELFTADEVCDGIFVGDIKSAFHRNGLKERGITHVVCMLPGLPNIHPEIAYLQLPSLDDASFDISVYFEQALAFIGTALCSGNVLVHCSCGVSRSATIAALYEMSRSAEDPDEVINRFRQARPVICPNPGFFLHLRNWHLARMLSRAMSSTSPL